ncbi:hypothetical protein DOTSEDRAFT_119161 [Dothistroma septosporum NZE10]|uniref:Uncharacterized protein n=1 Tax=Dothistroma septosporum (strain NZE10 / CBS 128990) TaxID=675120 RepID=N1Q2Y1_DOTSN|nr:hypothetical protein DOTSEDRAFT_119161 [Dothistroma septosporum NZE10]
MRLYHLTALAVSAAAFPQQYPGIGPRRQDFTLLMSLGAGETRTNLSLTAVKNGTSEVLLLAGADPATCVGTPAYLNASLSDFEDSDGEYGALQLDVDGQAYGVGIPPIGDMHGIAYSVTADKDYSEFQFRVIDGQVFHKPSSGASEFLVCNKNINGEVKPVLSWGSTPYAEGCSSSSVLQRCNIEGSGASCH